MRPILRGIFFFSFLISPFGFELVAQETENKPVLQIRRAKGAIKLDGILDEKDWLEADTTGRFHQQFPYDSSESKLRTVVRATYDDHFIYFGAVLYTKDPSKFVVPSLRRDFFGPGIDIFAIILDSFQDKTNAFTFGTNPAGVQREGLVSKGGVGFDQPVDFTWDNKWYNEVGITENAWVYEIAIPFKSIRFKAGSTQWNLNFFRQDSQVNEMAAWSRIPRNFSVFALNFHGILQFDEPLAKPGPNVSIIPYVASKSSRDYEEGTRQDLRMGYGADAKIAVTTSLNLDVTVNPDFSNTDVDQQQTNLNRFELYYPERRQFFLENRDLFADFGGESTRPFFSRRIGLALDTSTGQYIQNKIKYGARLSGNINKKWRMGLLNMQADSDPDISLPSYNFGVATVQRRVGTNSNVRAIMVNRQDFKNNEDYNRVAGIDYNYNFLGSRITGNVFAHQQFSPEYKGNEFSSKQFSRGMSFDYNSTGYFGGFSVNNIGENYDPVVGYLPRAGFNRLGSWSGYQWYPQSTLINRQNIGMFMSNVWDNKYGHSDRGTELWYEIGFLNTAQLNFRFTNTYTYLIDPYDPSETDGPELAQGTDYTYSQVSFQFQSNKRKKFNYELSGKTGRYYNGNLSGVNGKLLYRMQPYGVFSVDFDINRVTLPEPYNSADIFVIGPKIDLTLMRNVYWTSVIQYNSQFDNMNVNSRFQWRFKPVSDIFIVYTDNYLYDFRNTEDNFMVKNRSLVLKVTYWLNL